MFLLIDLLIGAGIGFFLPLNFAIGFGIFLALVVILFLFNANGKELDGIGFLIVAAFLGVFVCGLALGKTLSYVDIELTEQTINIEKPSNSNTTTESNINLPELICKVDNNAFILVNYKHDKDTIVNLKTDQIFNKSNCSLK